MTQEDSQFNPCACGCGELVRGTWKRGHASRGYAAMRPIPGPDAPDSAFDLGIIEPDGENLARHPYKPAAAHLADELAGLAADAGGQGDEDDVRAMADAMRDHAEESDQAASPGPAHARRDWRRKPRAKPRKDKPATPPRVTAGIRQDVDAKVSFMLEIPGRLWQAKDPVCGGAFVQQRPEIAGAMTEIICNSPELLAWFAGSGGAFMLYLNLLAACWPVLTLILAHHVYHSIDGEPYADEPAYGQYAA